jgi:lysophospholipase L1-like esterase
MSGRVLKGRGVSPQLLTLMLCALSLVVALALAEGMLRLFGYGAALQFDYRPDVGWVNEPNQRARTVGRWSVRINSAGLRGPEYRTPKPPGLFRILLVGDSFTFGYGVAEDSTYGAQLERLISARGVQCESVQVINGGVNGYNTEQAVAFVRNDGLRLEPDIVILGFNPNDIMARAEGKTMLRYPLLKKLLGRSALYQFFAPRVKTVMLRRAGEEYDSTIAKFIAGDPAVADRTDRVRQAVDSLHAVAKAHSFRLVLAIFPFADQVYGASTGDWPPRIFRRLDIPMLDLLPVLRAAGQEGQSLFLSEPTRHPNPRGLHLVAAELLKLLESHALLPACRRIPAGEAGVTAMADGEP